MGFREWIKERRRERELEEMDRRWEMSGASCREQFPPSYYYRYTAEELEKMKTERMENIKKLIEELDD